MAEPHPIYRNFWLKTFSVALATVIWLAIHYSIHNDVSVSQLNINHITVPVGITAKPGDARVFKTVPSEVIVFAVGDKATLRKGLRVNVDLTDFHDRKSSAEEVQCDHPPDINVVAVIPPAVAVEQVSP